MKADEAVRLAAEAQARGVRANLRRANLRRADLSEANLSGADLYVADLSEANLRRADLSEANLSATMVLQVGPLGSRRDYLVYMRHPDGTEECQAGCWRGTPAALAAAVEQRHGDNQYGRQYRAALATVAAFTTPENRP